MVLFELNQPRLVFYLLVQAPHLIDEHCCFKVDHILLFGTEREHLVVLLVVNDLVEEVSVAKLDHCLFRSADFG
jgi:hypothetical protein